jgi:hypothetical protein
VVVTIQPNPVWEEEGSDSLNDVFLEVQSAHYTATGRLRYYVMHVFDRAVIGVFVKKTAAGCAGFFWIECL